MATKVAQYLNYVDQKLSQVRAVLQGKRVNAIKEKENRFKWAMSDTDVVSLEAASKSNFPVKKVNSARSKWRNLDRFRLVEKGKWRKKRPTKKSFEVIEEEKSPMRWAP